MEDKKEDTCIYTKFRKIEKGCMCDETCDYYINHKNSHNCALEFANKGEHTLKEIAKVMDYTSTGIMVIQNNALKKIFRKIPKEFFDEESD